jgi:hypothetical protein
MPLHMSAFKSRISIIYKMAVYVSTHVSTQQQYQYHI